MGVELQLRGDKLIAALSGDIDHHSAPKFREAIDAKAAQIRPRELVMDFGRVTFMDSSGIGLILGRYRWMQELGGTVRIAHISQRMEQILILSGINQLVRIEPAENDKTKKNLSDDAHQSDKNGHTDSREIYGDSAKEVNYHG